MHFDLWFGPLNIAMDAGTYLYNAEPPWENAFSGARHHNTVLLDGAEAMLRAGRFLWLNWNQSKLRGIWRSEHGGLDVLTAERFADLDRELIQRRTVIRAGDRRWTVIDDILGAGLHKIDLGWLLPDLPWALDKGALRLETPVGEVALKVASEVTQQWLMRAGNIVHGEEFDELGGTLGWFSPTYALKIPALHFVTRCETDLPLRIQSDWLWEADDHEQFQLGWEALSAGELPLRWVRYQAEYLELNDAYSFNPSSIR
jgi:hypothetical protein